MSLTWHFPPLSLACSLFETWAFSPPYTDYWSSFVAPGWPSLGHWPWEYGPGRLTAPPSLHFIKSVSSQRETCNIHTHNTCVQGSFHESRPFNGILTLWVKNHWTIGTRKGRLRKVEQNWPKLRIQEIHVCWIVDIKRENAIETDLFLWRWETFQSFLRTLLSVTERTKVHSAIHMPWPAGWNSRATPAYLHDKRL